MHENKAISSGEPPVLEIDLDCYMPLFEDESISDADKRKLLEALWSIMLSFAQLGWGFHPVQQARAARGRAEGVGGPSDENSAVLPIPTSFAIETKRNTLIDKFIGVSVSAAQEG